MSYIRSSKPIDKEKRNTLIIRICIGAICLLAFLTIFLNIYKITTVFNETYKTAYADYLKDKYGQEADKINGISANITGLEIAFGVKDYKAPFQLPAEPIVAICFFAILLFGLLAIPFGKIESNKLFSTTKYIIGGLGLIVFSIIYLVFLDGASDELAKTITGTTEGIPQMFSNATIKINDLNAVSFFFVIVAGFAFLFLAYKAYKNKNIYSKKVR